MRIRVVLLPEKWSSCKYERWKRIEAGLYWNLSHPDDEFMVFLYVVIEIDMCREFPGRVVA